eukprot:7956851-Ditylum_brightwellii.AAC.1
MIPKRWSVVAAAILSLARLDQSYGQSQQCTPVSAWSDIIDAIEDAAKSGEMMPSIFFCPFSIVHDGTEADGYDLTLSDATL